MTCKRKGRDNSDKQVYHVGVKIQMSKSSLTKIITFTPYYLVLNTADFSISIRDGFISQICLIMIQVGAVFRPICLDLQLKLK